MSDYEPHPPQLEPDSGPNPAPLAPPVEAATFTEQDWRDIAAMLGAYRDVRGAQGRAAAPIVDGNGWIVDVVQNNIIDPAWGNAIRDHCLINFPSATARDNSIPLGKRFLGMVCTVAGELQMWNGANWLSAQPHGLLETNDRGTEQVTIDPNNPALRDVNVWTGGTLDKPVHVGRTGLVSVSFSPYQYGGTVVLEVRAQLGPSQVRTMGTFGVTDAAIQYGINTPFQGMAAFPNNAPSTDWNQVAVNVKYLGGAAAVLNQIRIDVIEV
jgi:hypothetical protein